MSKRATPPLEVRLYSQEPHKQLYINHRLILSHQAQYAMELLKIEIAAMEPMNAWGVVGDGSFQPFQRTSVPGAVKRACDASEALFKEIEKRGWCAAGPDLDEVFSKEDSKAPFGMHARVEK